MFPGDQVYDRYVSPERGGEHNWHVWNEPGALEVLDKNEFEVLGAGESYTVNFANGSAARLVEGDLLWRKLAEITATHDVAVFGLGLSTSSYTPWTSRTGSMKTFDAIRITARPV